MHTAFPMTGPPHAAGPNAHLDARQALIGGSRLRGLAVLAATACLLGVLLMTVDAAAVGEQLATARPHLLLACAAIALCFPLIAALRWTVLLRALGVDLEYRRALVVVLGIFPVNAISPARAGDVLRAYSLRGQAPAETVLGGLLAERMLDVAVLGTIALASAAAFGHWALAAPAAGAVLAAFAICLIASQVHRLPIRGAIAEKLSRFSAAQPRLARRPGAMALAVTLSLCHWFAALLVVTLLFGAVGADLSIIDVAMAMPLAIFVGLLPVTLGGIGTRDGAMVLLFSAMALPEQILAVSLLYTAFVYFFLALIGLPFVGKAFRRRDMAQC